MSFNNYYNDFSQQSYFETKYEEVSEPLVEYKVCYDGSLEEVCRTLFGVKKNGKWGWVDSSDRIVIPFEYDSGFVTCYDGVINLERYGKCGGLYRNSLRRAFDFIYDNLSHIYCDTYLGWKGDKCALIKPGDKRLTDFKYSGFSIYRSGYITEYVRFDFLGRKITGNIDLRNRN